MKTLLKTFRLSAIALLTSSAPLFAGGVAEKWVKRFDSPLHFQDQSRAVVIDAGGNVVVTGSSGSDFYTAKYADADGALVWQRSYNGPGPGTDEPRAVAADGSGNVVVTGYSFGISGIPGNRDYFTAKYAAADGVLLWEKRYDGPIGELDEATAIATDAVGNVIVTGSSMEGGTDFYTAKYAAANGALIWEKRYDGTGNGEDFATAMTVDGGGNVIVTGYSEGAGTFFDYYTAKYAAADGALIWERRYSSGGLKGDFAEAVTVDGAGNVIVTGFSVGAEGNYDYYTAKYAAANGAILWANRFNGPGNGDDRGYAVVSDSAGDVTVTGYSVGAGGSKDFYTAKYASLDGSLLWEKRYDGPAASLDEAHAVAVDGGGNVVVSGYSSGVGTGFDYYTAKYATADGALIWEKRYNGSANSSDIVDRKTQLVLTADGGAVVAGSSYNGTTMDFATVRYVPDSTTLPPTLTTPAANTFINSTVNVAFSLPEAALPGSVTLTFAGASLTRVLTLAGSQETAGAHSFSFDVGAPVGAPEVASGLPLEVDGAYTVTLSYRDALGNPAATAVAANVTLDTVPPTLSGTFSPLRVNFGDEVAEYYTQAVTDGVSLVQFTPLLNGNGSWNLLGVFTVQVTAYDEAGNDASLYFDVEVVPPNPIRSVLGSKGSPVPGAGVEGSGIPAGAVWNTFGVPSINDAGQAAVLASFKVGSVTTTAILGWELGTPEGMKVVARKGQEVGDDLGVIISAFKEPALGADGAVAWIATVAHSPGYSPRTLRNNKAICYMPDVLNPGMVRSVALSGEGLFWRTFTGAMSEVAVEFSAFTSVAVGRSSVAFTGKLASKTAGVSPGPGGVTTGNDSGLWTWDMDSSTVALALREGDPLQSVLLGSPVKTISALVARPGSAGQGQGTHYGQLLTDDFTSVRVTLADGRQAVGAVFGGDGRHWFSHISGESAVGYGAGAIWQSFGLPTQNAVNNGLAFIGTVKAGTGTATSASNVAIFAEDDQDYPEVARIVGKGDVAPGCAGIFASFKDPVNASGRGVAFHGTMKPVPGAITAANNDGIWWNSASGLGLVAREGAQPPEAPEGAQWKAFTSLALPEGRGPLFVASMHSKTGTASPGPGGVTSANDVGLWATDSFGELRLLMREGDAIGASTVKTFTVLSSVLGSPAQTRSFNNSGNVIVRVTDATGAQHLVLIAVP